MELISVETIANEYGLKRTRTLAYFTLFKSNSSESMIIKQICDFLKFEPRSKPESPVNRISFKLRLKVAMQGDSRSAAQINV